MLSRLRLFGLFVAAAAVPCRLSSQGWIEPVRPVPGWGVEKLRSAVSVAVKDRVAEVTVEEWFQNRGPMLGEGIYHYPLPGEAAFSSFSLWQGDAELRGETMDATQARSIYEEIVRRKRDPALIELAGHGLIRARIFPINPGETRKITLRYTQILDREGDAWRFRYVAGSGPGAAGATRSFRLSADSGDRFGDPYSPTHQISARRSGGRLEVTLADSATAGDLDLFLPLARGLVGVSLVTHQLPGEDGYFMLLLAPGAAHPAAAVRRDLVVAIDVSGSMSGEKLAQAKAAVGQLLGSLHDGDRFRLVAFESGVRRFDADWTAATADGRRRALAWVNALETGGGTNIAGALDEASSQPPAAGSLGVIIFLTDGLPTVGEQDPEKIAARAEEHRGAFRVFSFGIGYDVNTYLLDRLTERARGVTEYIAPGSDIERAVGTLAGKIASPVLTDVTLNGDGVELYDVQPQTLPDLFAGDELVAFGRYHARNTTGWSVAVRGRRGSGEEQFRSATVGEASANAYIPRLWASRKAGALSREIRLHGSTPETLAALKELALRYGILTEYTSYLVQEPSVAMGRADSGIVRPVIIDGAVAGAAFAPSAQNGVVAVRQSQAEANLAAKSVDLEDRDELSVRIRGRSGINPTRRVGGRLFILRDSVWTDLAARDAQRLVTVTPFSDAYFALLRSLPELTPAVGLTPGVLVAGRRVNIKIAAAGVETWKTGELERIVADFR
jgi:Ca-activated chloride channel family protein